MKGIPLHSGSWRAVALSGLVIVAGHVFAAEPQSTVPTRTTEEQALARKPLEAYMQGHATGDPAHIRRAFLPTARIEGLRDGKIVSRTLEEFAAGFSGKPAEDEAQRQRRIDALDISGTAAMARVTLDYPAVTFTDYFVLLKVDGEWKIASKVYSAQKK
ncbi:nuclear transport factor 2 family protein [Lysobacter sp. CFH 32150]|uniref:nuclear transport factor 2 family protein n=1 Tax=Lysobacter sp. CFH 32150 TaxID=2927128 RepID=UPI001FA6D131|nr:nuclear transport factor 2 family protein [Lysobacter sp. CFH 32150]MCI4566614.1 nuclear transport factor 2 family protein [Lysobacter sp. CFH 32150]